MFTASKALVCTLSLTALAAPRSASAQTSVESVVQTEDAVYFVPTVDPSVVWFVPRLVQRVVSVDLPFPGSLYLRAAVALRSTTLQDPAALDPSWQGKTLVPFILRPTEECTLPHEPALRSLRQEVFARGRDVSAADALPVCQFIFRLVQPGAEPVRADLERRAAARTLVHFDLSLSLLQRTEISWHSLHQKVWVALGGGVYPGPARSEADVRSLLESAVAGAIPTAASVADRDALVTAALATLFEPADPPGSLRLVRVAPLGSYQLLTPVVIAL
jgi:hypothetical protein